MSTRVHLSPTAPAALVELRGLVRWNDIASAFLHLYGGPVVRPGLAVLWDGRGITSLDVAPHHLPRLQSLLARVGRSLAVGRSAIVVRRDIDREIARLLLLRSSCQGRSYEVFLCLEKGLAFLGHPALPVAEVGGG